MDTFANGHGWGHGWGSGGGGSTGGIVQLGSFEDLPTVAVPPAVPLQGAGDARAFNELDVHPDLWASLHAGDVARASGLMQGSGTGDGNALEAALGKRLAHGNKLLGIPTGGASQDDISNELTARTDRVNLRSRGGEIAAQSGSFQQFYFQMLNLNPKEHPTTIRLISLAYATAGIVGLSYKLHYMRPRPSHVFPGFNPVLPNPPHPSFPSNHATQAHTVSRLLKKIIETVPPKKKGESASIVPNGLSEHLVMLAERIAENREIAGVHFNSDTLAGEDIAEQLVEKIYDHSVIAGMLDECRAELARFLS